MVFTNKKSLVWGLIILLILQFSIAGCQKKPEAKPSQKSTQGQKTKPPEDAKKISEEIDKVLKGLDTKALKEKLPELAQQQSEAEKKSSENQSSSSSDSQGGQNQQKEGNSSEKNQQGKESSSSSEQKSKQQTSSTSDWQTETSSVMKIHQSWNAMEPEAIKAGVTTEDLDAFETSLDALTLALSKKNLMDSMQAAITLYRDFGQVMSYFASDLPKEYYQVKYMVMMAMLEAYKGNWDAASQNIMDVEDPWSRLHTQMDKKHKEDTDKTEFAIKDLDRAVSQKDVGLTYIKGEIVLNDLKKFESQGQGQGQEEGQQ